MRCPCFRGWIACNNSSWGKESVLIREVCPHFRGVPREGSTVFYLCVNVFHWRYVISPVAMAHVCRSSQRLPQHLVEEDAGKLRFNPRRQQPPSPSQRRGPGLIPVPNFKNRRLTSFSMSPQVLATTQNFNGYSIGSLVVFGYSFLLASFVLFLVNEKETKV